MNGGSVKSLSTSDLRCALDNKSQRLFEPMPAKKLIVGTFFPAADCLKSALKRLETSVWYKPKPVLKLKVQEMNEVTILFETQREFHHLNFCN